MDSESATARRVSSWRNATRVGDTDSTPRCSAAPRAERPSLTNASTSHRSAAEGTTESGVVETCWLLAELIVLHELMEAFEVRGVKIFDPHHTVEELSMPHEARKRRLTSG